MDKLNKTVSYVIVIQDSEGHIRDTPFASFDRGLAEEVALEYAWELMWEHWYWLCHGPCEFVGGWVSLVYENKLTDYHVIVREIPWYG